MIFRYSILSKVFGSGVATETVLIKCLFDQVFFATQQDGLFLALCAYNNSEKLPQAIEEVKKNFLTTWIADCSVWPLVNFFGFAFVPYKIQPAYMAVVQFFWYGYSKLLIISSPSVPNIIWYQIESKLKNWKLKYLFPIL